MEYRIFETNRFATDLQSLGPAVRNRIHRKLLEHTYPALRHNPRWGPNIKRPTGFEPPTWRYRIGSWRFFYTIDDQEAVVSMLAADHRGHAYR